VTNSSVLFALPSKFQPLLLVSENERDGAPALHWISEGLLVRVVRGSRMRTDHELFNEFSAAFQFSLYFGHNWDAFDECLRELEGLNPTKGIVVVITEAPEVLANEGPNEMLSFVRMLESAVLAWREPVSVGEAWDRPSIPFHVVLVTPSRDVEVTARRWSDSGAPPAPLSR
jgi:hypothetical protein